MNVHTVSGRRIGEVTAAIAARVGNDRAHAAAVLVSASKQADNLHRALHRGISEEALCLMAGALQMTLTRAIVACGVDAGDAEALERAVDADITDAVRRVQRKDITDDPSH
jgi:hypothetical protein